MISVVIYFVFIAQSSASFYDELTHALGSVEEKVGKLITDVRTDLRDTYDCAIDAIEEVIYDKDQISKYYDKCKQTSTERSTVPVINNVPPTISIYVKPIISESSKDDVSTKSGNDRDPKEIDKKLASVEQVVNNEYNRVDNMSSHLEHEFNDLSKNVDEKLRMIEKEKADLQETLLEIKNLNLEEEKQIEKTKDEIRKVFEEILKKINSSTKESDLRSEMNAAIGDIEKNTSKTISEEIVKWKERGLEQLKGFQQTTNSTSSSLTESNTPRTFKELAAKILKETTTINNMNKESSTSSPTIISTQAAIQASSTAKINSVKLPSQPLLSSSTVSSERLVTRALSATNNISLTEPVTQPVTAIYTTAVTSAPITRTTLSAIESVAQSSTVVTTTSAPSTSTTPVIQSSTAVTTTPEEPVTVASRVNTTTSPELVAVTSTITTATSVEPVTVASTITTTTSTEPVTVASTITTTTFAEPVTVASTITTATSTEPVTVASTITTTTSTEPVTMASTLTTTTSTEPVTLTSIVSTTTSAIPATRVSTTSSTTKQVTQLLIVNTKKPRSELRSTTTATTSEEPITLLTHMMNKTLKERTIKPKINNKSMSIHTSPKHNLKLTSSTPIPNEVYHHTPKNTAAAVAEALKIFSNSLKTKSVLNKFFKNLDSIPATKVY